MKTIHFKSFGCKVNQYEIQLLRELFREAGFSEGSKASSNLYIINSCSLTKNTDRKVRQYISEVRHFSPKAKVFVTGCGVFNPESNLTKSNGVEIFKKKDKRELFKKITLAKEYPFGIIHAFSGHQRAFVKVQDGCDNFCSYCIIPYLRGKPISRNSKEILTEVGALVNNGFKEIVLCGINLGAYELEKNEGLIGLLRKILSLEGDFRLRLSSIEPNYVTEGLIELMVENEKICPHLHLPLQSGDDKILKLMNRKCSIKDYLCLLNRIKKKVRNVSFTTDILIGFPQETETNFKNTLKAIKEVDFLKTHIFSYSKREKTNSAKLEGHLSREAILDRRREAKLVADKASYHFRKKFKDKVLSVLIEERKNKKTADNFGFSSNYIEVQVKDSNSCINNIKEVKVTEVKQDETRAILA